MRTERVRVVIGASGLALLGLLAGTNVCAELRVSGAQVGRSIDRETRSIVDPGTAFPADVGQLACLTRIEGAEGETSVVHVWLEGDRERARVTLPVRGPSWRTWSTKRIPTVDPGDWSVEVRNEAGQVLDRIAFRLGTATPPETAMTAEAGTGETAETP